MGWWRRSSTLKRTHFQEDENEFHHLLIIEALGGDQAWGDRFIGQHSALIYYLVITLMWIGIAGLSRIKLVTPAHSPSETRDRTDHGAIRYSHHTFSLAHARLQLFGAD